jgi:hypothetical protein
MAVAKLSTEVKADAQEDIAEKLGSTKKEMMAYMKPIMDKMLYEHDAMIAEADTKMDAIEDGDDGHTPTTEELIALITPLIPQAIAGQDAVVDHEAIVASVLEKMPKQSVGRIGWGAHPLVIQDSSSTIEKVARNIKFGTNLTATRSADGVVTVNATGGSGFTELVATGTVNGLNATFTFIQKPSYLISDGVWMKENHGWTWSVLTATLSVAPVDIIYGIA